MTPVIVDYEPLIHAALADAVDAASFPLVEYNFGRMNILDEAGRPTSVVVHQETSEFSESRDKRTFRLERTGWAWRLELSFKGHASCGAFERSLIESPPRILRDRAAGRDQQVTLILTGSAYQTPPEGQPSSGLRATYRFTAKLTPS